MITPINISDWKILFFSNFILFLFSSRPRVVAVFKSNTPLNYSLVFLFASNPFIAPDVVLSPYGITKILLIVFRYLFHWDVQWEDGCIMSHTFWICEVSGDKTVMSTVPFLHLMSKLSWSYSPFRFPLLGLHHRFLLIPMNWAVTGTHF